MDPYNVAPSSHTYMASKLPRAIAQPDTKELQRQALELELANLTRTAVELMNKREFGNPWFEQHVAPDVRVEMMDKVTIGRVHFTRNYSEYSELSPAFRVELANITAVVDERGNSGTAIMSQDMHAFDATGRRMAGSMLYNWTRKSPMRQWMVQSAIMIVGTPVFLP